MVYRNVFNSTSWAPTRLQIPERTLKTMISEFLKDDNIELETPKVSNRTLLFLGVCTETLGTCYNAKTLIGSSGVTRVAILYLHFSFQTSTPVVIIPWESQGLKGSSVAMAPISLMPFN